MSGLSSAPVILRADGTRNDKRFEVDGAIGARTWLSEHPIGKYWAPDRVRKVFQAIALHGSGSIVNFFELLLGRVMDKWKTVFASLSASG